MFLHATHASSQASCISALFSAVEIRFLATVACRQTLNPKPYTLNSKCMVWMRPEAGYVAPFCDYSVHAPPRHGRIVARMPSSTLIPFLVGLGSLINPFKQKRAPFFILGYWTT